MRAIPQAATDFVAAHEALRLTTYADPAGACTIGFGHTGAAVHAGMRITADQARAWLASDLQAAAARLAGVVDGAVIDELTDAQYAALLSFVFNLGADAKWTIWKRLNARQFDQVPVELMRFVYCGKTKLQGLVNRRAAEAALWSQGEPGSRPDAPPSSFTRAEPTPPASAEPRPLHRQPAFLATAAAVALGAPEAIARISAAVAPYTDQSALAQRLAAALAEAGPVAAALAAAVLWLQHRQAKL